MTISSSRYRLTATRTLIRSSATAAVGLLLLGTAAACSDQTSDAADKAGATATTIAASEPQPAGSGEIESASGGLGTRSKRIPKLLLKEMANEEDSIYLATPEANLCESLDPSIARHDFSRFGIKATYYEVADYYGDITLVCSAPQGAIWPLTTGPGNDGISVPCPEHKPRAVADMGAAYFKYTDDGTKASNISKSGGGRGYNNDGLWNFKFHNWNTRDVTPTMWLVCE